MSRRPATTDTAASARTPVLLGLMAALALLLALLVATPATAESECISDPAGDVEDRNQQPPATVEQPKGDLLAVCVSFSSTALQIDVRLAEPSDPATDPDWDQQATAIGVAIDTDGITTEEGTGAAPGGEEFTVNLGRFPTQDPETNTPPQTRVYLANTNDTLATDDGEPCILPAVFDGLRYRMTLPIGCLALPDAGIPEQVQVAAYVFFRSNIPGQTSAGLFDEAPVFPEYQGPFTTAPDPETPVDRLAGPSRHETAIAVSRDDFGDGAATAVVLARADAAPDALASAPLAVATGGPLLLTNRDILFEDVEAEIQRVLPAGGTVYLAGGTAALSEGVADAVSALGYTVVRAAGPSRYATSVEVARRAVPEPELIVVADGNDFPDALVGGALAAAEGGVQVLSDGPRLDDTAQAYLAEHPDAEVVAVGAVAAQAVPSATPLVGDDVFATSVVVAERYGDVTGIGVASGTAFPDGLTGGAHVGRAGIPLLLSWPDVLPDAVEAHVDTLVPLERIVMYGGVAALSHQVEEDLATALG